MTKRCGDCQLCCTLIPVKELKKPGNSVCEHQCASGCGIYTDRPQECRTYQCLWRSEEEFPDEYRPDRIDCVIDLHETSIGLAVFCHQMREGQWQEENIYGLLIRIAKYNDCWICAVYGDKVAMAFPEWASEQQKTFDAEIAKGKTELDFYGEIIHKDE